MCGLFGLYEFDQSSDLVSVQRCYNKTFRALSHRGPDNHGLETFRIRRKDSTQLGSLSLGHTRLSIIDLSPQAHQPMQSLDGRYTIVFNGEIYNYQELRADLETEGLTFCTGSDTEVLLAAWANWGISGLRRLIGMFAFAIYDRESNSVTLVRDAFGIKPVFYTSDESSVAFASELPALVTLMAQTPEVNLQQAYDYLCYGYYDDAQASFFKNVFHLQSGHYLTIDLNLMQLEAPKRWWWPSVKERTDLSFEDAAVKLRELFLSSVNLHLRSDVSLGAALSGGVDSSAIACAMRHLQPDMPIHTFTYSDSSSENDEGCWANIVNKHVNAIEHPVLLDSPSFASDLDRLVSAQGEPFGGTSIYAQFCIFKKARESGITVMLDGQGADELLAGYNGFPESVFKSLFDQRRFAEIFRFMNRWSDWPGRGFLNAILRLVRTFLPKSLHQQALRVVGKLPPKSWFDKSFLAKSSIRLSPPEVRADLLDTRGRRLVGALRQSLTGIPLQPLLRHGDRNSMYWSIESRVPFLTIDLAEFVLSLPESYLVSRDGETKYIFREAMRGIVPDEILNRRDKIGFRTSEQELLRKNSDLVDDWLRGLEHLPFIDAVQTRSDIRRMLSNKNSFDHRVWRVINLCRWISLNK